MEPIANKELKYKITHTQEFGGKGQEELNEKMELYINTFHFM